MKNFILTQEKFNGDFYNRVLYNGVMKKLMEKNTEYMTPGERLKYRMHKLGISQEGLAILIRKNNPGKFKTLDQSGISQFCRGSIVRSAWLPEAVRELSTSYEWIMNHEGSEEVINVKNYKQSVTQLQRENGSINPENIYDLIPLYGPASASSNENIRLTEEFIVGQEARPPALQNVRGGFMMLVAGDSMEPRMFRGGKLWVHPYQKPIPTDDCIVVMKEDGNAIVKEYVGETATEINLLQLNPKKGLTIKKSDIEKIFLVIGIQRR